MRATAQVNRSIVEIHALNKVLQKDSMLGLEYLHREFQRYKNGEIESNEMHIWIRAAVRAFFAQVDGLCYAMRRAVLHSASSVGLQIDNKIRAELAERAYDKHTDTVLDTFKPTQFRKNMKNAFRYFPQLFGADFELETQKSTEWLGFTKCIKSRNGMTHPKSLQDLHTSILALHTLQPSMVYFFGQVTAMMAACEKSPPEATRQNPTPFDPRVFDQTEKELSTGTGFYEAVRDSATGSLKYLRPMLEILRKDTSSAWGLYDQWSSLKRQSDPRLQFCLRTVVRTMFSEIEGTSSAVKFYLESAKHRDSDIDFEFAKSSDVCEDYADIVNTYTRVLGQDKPVSTSGAGWNAFRKAAKIRDKITHPKRVRDMEISFKSMTKTMMPMYRWSVQGFEALMLDIEKYTKHLKRCGYTDDEPGS